ncbi:MAG: PBP1A family penicillin-binding protein [Chloroflexota bacterium]
MAYRPLARRSHHVTPAGRAEGRVSPSSNLQYRARIRARRRRRTVRSAFKLALLFTMVVFLVGCAGAGAAVGAAASAASTAWNRLNADLPSINQISGRETFKTAQVFDRNGTLLWEFFDEGGRRTVVPLAEVSQYMIDAQLAAEDPNFYSNPGIDPRGIARAVYQNLMADEVISGASTITQQLVRNVLLSPDERYDRSMMRKVREALLAYQVTQKLSKSQILALYLNEIYYGNLTYGVEAAAQGYFGKHARDLSLAEASMIAGLAQSPANYDPLRNPVAAKQRQAYVLDQMVRHEFVTEAQAQEARQSELRYQPWKSPYLAPHWVTYIKGLVEEKQGGRALATGGLKIYTTLDLELQRKMEEVARANAPNLAIRDANNTSIVVINPKTGEVLAMVGSMDFENTAIDGQVNVAISERQPGSTIKPLVYLAAFTRGYVPSTTVVDERISIPDDLGRVWSPENYDKKFRGTVTLRTALGNSLNIPAVKVLQFAGIDNVFDLARRMGLRTWDDPKRLGLAMSLGGAEVRPVDLTAAYAVLANNGLKIPPVAITRIINADGVAVENYQVPRGDQVVDPRFAYMLTNVLSDNNARLVTFGPNSMINMPRAAAVKTGTTDNYRDTWTMGYTPNLVIGVWVGNTDNHPMKEVLSSMSAGKVWREAMDTAIDHLNLPPEEFVRPSGLLDVEVCGDGGMRPGQGPCYRDLFLAERAPSSQRVFVGGFQLPTASPEPGPATPAPARSPVPEAAAKPTIEPEPTATSPSIVIQPVVPGRGPSTPPVAATAPPAPTPVPKPAVTAPPPTATARPSNTPVRPPPTPVPPTATPRRR